MEDHDADAPKHLIHGRHPCSSCPFRVDGDGWFDPDTLDHSVGDNLRSGYYAHRCHKTLHGKKENICVGFLRFLAHNGQKNTLVEMGIRMGIIDPKTLSDDVPIHTSWDDVLNAHEARMLNDLDDSITSTVPPQGQTP